MLVTQNGHCHHSEHGDQTPESHQALPLPHQKQINATKVDRDKFKRDKFDQRKFRGRNFRVTDF